MSIPGRFPKEAVTRVLEGLGPDRVARAVNHPALKAEDWRSCFLACAYGEPGDLLGAMTEEVQDMIAAGKLRPYAFPAERHAAVVLGMSREDVTAVVRAFDEPVDRPHLLALATEWLEANRNETVTRVPEEVAR